MSRRLPGLALPLLLGVAGCAALPGAGPSASSLHRAPDVDVVAITPDVATAAHDVAEAQEQAARTRALASLRAPAAEPAFRIQPGDTLDVTIWSFSPWPGSADPLAVGNPGPIPLGTIAVGPDGAVQLPYAGRVALAGMGLEQAQAAISARYAALRILQKPTAALRLAASPRHDVLVTGAIGQPRTIPWSPAGLSLAQAVTLALGDGSAALGQGELSQTRSAVRVTVLRGDSAPVELPIATALEERIPLHAGDRVIVRKDPAVKVTMLGGGTRRNGVLGFARRPALAEALAEASGLDGNAANDHAVFVLRRRAGRRPVLFDFAWNRPLGIVAAQAFPLEDGDLVYVAEAPIVPVQRVINLLFQATLPMQVLKQ